MFTRRQTTLLSYLISNSEGIPGKDLSNLLDVSLKTVQLEVKKINQILKDEERIIFIPKKGYVIENISTETKNQIITAINQDKNKLADSYRINKIITILLFEKSYISMEKLAERLFISKSAVNSDLSILRRLKIVDTDEAKLEISLNKGLRIHASESTKRYMLSKVLTNDFDLDILLLSNYNINIIELENNLLKILSEAFIKYDYIVSGESLQVFKNYLLISIIRNKYGFNIEENHSKLKIVTIMQHIFDRIREKLGFSFDFSEMIYNQNKLNELNLLNNEDISNGYLETNLNCFIKKIKEDLGIDFKYKGQLKNMFLLHMQKLLIRIENNHDNTNFLKREINRKYPMSAHIISEYFIPIFKLPIPESEISHLVLYIGSEIEIKENKLKVIFISDFNASVIYNSKIKMEDNFRNLIKIIDIVPLYVFNARKESLKNQYDIIITTEREIVLYDSQAILIKSIISDNDISILGKKINQIANSLEKEKFKELCSKLINDGSIIVIKQTLNTVEELFDLLQLKYVKNNYELVLDSNVAFFPRFIYEDEKSYIKLCILEHPIKYRSKYISLVVISGYNINDKAINEFYSIIKFIIEPDQVEYIVKHKHL